MNINEPEISPPLPDKQPPFDKYTGILATPALPYL